jgi:hypothetical protein
MTKWAFVDSVQQATFLELVEDSDVHSPVHRPRVPTINLGSRNFHQVVEREMANLVLVVIYLLLQSGIVDNPTIRLHSHRDLCKKVLIGVHGCILGRGLDYNLVVLGICHVGKDFLHRMF